MNRHRVVPASWRPGRVWALFALGLVLGSAAPVGAQSFGARGGVTLSTLSFSDDFAESTPAAPGAVGGGYFALGLPWRLKIHVEALMSLERATVETGPESRFRYLDVPLLVRRPLPGLRAVGGRPIVVEAGAVYRRLLDASESIAGESYSIKEGVRSDDVAFAAGVEVPLLSAWSIDVRYLHGQNGVLRRFNGSYAGVWRSVQIAARYAIKN